MPVRNPDSRCLCQLIIGPQQKHLSFVRAHESGCSVALRPPLSRIFRQVVPRPLFFSRYFVVSLVAPKASPHVSFTNRSPTWAFANLSADLRPRPHTSTPRPALRPTRQSFIVADAPAAPPPAPLHLPSSVSVVAAVWIVGRREGEGEGKGRRRGGGAARSCRDDKALTRMWKFG